jgi:hypothetical protein
VAVAAAAAAARQDGRTEGRRRFERARVCFVSGEHKAGNKVGGVSQEESLSITHSHAF